MTNRQGSRVPIACLCAAWIAGCAAPAVTGQQNASVPDSSGPAAETQTAENEERRVVSAAPVPTDLTLSLRERRACTEEPRRMAAFTKADLEAARASLAYEPHLTTFFEQEIVKEGGEPFADRIAVFAGGRDTVKSREARIGPTFLCVFHRHGDTWTYIDKTPYDPERNSLFVNQYFHSRFVRDVRKLGAAKDRIAFAGQKGDGGPSVVH